MNQREHELAVALRDAIARATVRLGALRANYAETRRRSGGALAAPVVKANAYGLGLEPVARALAEAGADSFFVARLEEGMALRSVERKARIFVLDGVAPGTAPALEAYALTPVLNSAPEIAEWSALASMRKTKLAAVLHVDTGMNRLGIPPDEATEIAARPERVLKGLDVQLIMSHLACADDVSHAMNRAQLDRFRTLLAQLPSAPASLAASAGIELGRDYHFDMVRPGLAIYGGNPVLTQKNPYRRVVRLISQILQLRHLGPDDAVGYAKRFTARRPSVIATVAAGYGDGLLRASGTNGHAAVGGVRVAFAGRISMDVLSLDVTDAPPEARVRGGEVEFFGDCVTLEEAAAAAGTITHEVLTSISARASRVYVEED